MCLRMCKGDQVLEEAGGVRSGAVNCLTWVQEINPESSGKAVCARNHQTVSSALFIICCFIYLNVTRVVSLQEAEAGGSWISRSLGNTENKYPALPLIIKFKTKGKPSQPRFCKNAYKRTETRVQPTPYRAGLRGRVWRCRPQAHTILEVHF